VGRIDRLDLQKNVDNVFVTTKFLLLSMGHFPEDKPKSANEAAMKRSSVAMRLFAPVPTS
jgi:hypothetical protein